MGKPSLLVGLSKKSNLDSPPALSNKSNTMAIIKVIQEEEATGLLKDIYTDLIAKRGKLAEVHKILSLNPKTIISHMELYMDIMYGQSPLSRAQRELMAVVVSIANNCLYCTQHHAAALEALWKDEQKVKDLVAGKEIEGLKEVDYLLIKLAKTLTAAPSGEEKNIWVDKLKSLGIDDRSILDANLVIAYFNFVNRIILGLGINLEEDEGKGYRYE
jgi:uncharacterized peroxidase-related enzyme